LEHTIFSDGTPKQISWIIKTGDSIIEQKRDHADIYLDKVTTEQSKYIALHVGIFWCIGRFIIKNEDILNVMLDSKTMFEHLTNYSPSPDGFTNTRASFLQQLIEQRRLKIKYHLIDSKENIANMLLE